MNNTKKIRKELALNNPDLHLVCQWLTDQVDRLDGDRTTPQSASPAEPPATMEIRHHEAPPLRVRRKPTADRP